MKQASIVSRLSRISLGIALVWLSMAPSSFADRRTGEAVVAGQVGRAQARIFTGPVHEGKTKLVDLNQGSSVGETSRILTGKDGRLCVVLSPGAILCVAPETELTFRQLRHAANGLPQSEDDLIRRIHIDLIKGRVLLHAGAPTASMDIKVSVNAGEVESNGGTFVIAQNAKNEWIVISEEHEQTIKPNEGEQTKISKGDAVTLSLNENGKGEIKDDKNLLDSPKRQFELCNTFFQDLEPFIEDPVRFDRQGLGAYIGSPGIINFIGSGSAVSDVSPSFRPVTMASIRPPMPKDGEAGAGGRWDEQRIWAWYDDIGAVKGVNYIPRNAVNSTEMWSEDSFDEKIIDEELGWAKKSGYTTVRVQLQYLVWSSDTNGFTSRFDKFLEIAARHDLRVVPVLFDDLNLAGKEPSIGPQPEPIPGEYNARWTPSPGSTLAKNRDAWPDLERYVKTITEKFKKDDRILYWDLYNTTGNNEMWEDSLPLMDQAFNWVRKVDPKQPLAVAVWTLYGSAMSSRKLERSDIITFQSFENVEQVEALVMLLKRHNRPIICSNWLMRQQNSTFEKILPLFAANRIGWFNHGLVQGKTQQWLQQAKFRSTSNPDIWQQDVLTSNGEAYDPNEIELIQSFRFLEGF